MTSNFKLDFVDHETYPESIFSFYPLDRDSLKSNKSLMEMITQWLIVWNFQGFNEIFARILQSNTVQNNLESYCFYIQHNVISNKPVGLLILGHYRLPTKVLTERLILYWILDPYIFKQNLFDLVKFITATQFWDLIHYTCQQLHLNFYHIAFYGMEWPITQETQQFASLVGVSAREYEKNPSLNAQWIYYIYSFDHKIESQQDLLGYNHTFHFLNYNPYFDTHYFPEELSLRMEQAIIFFQCIQTEVNPSFLNQETLEWFKKILIVKKNIEKMYNRIKPHLDLYKRELDHLRMKYLTPTIKHSNPNEEKNDFKQKADISVVNYCRFIKHEIMLLHRFNFRCRILDSHSLEFSDVVLHQTALLQLNIIQTITTEGSMFDSVIDEHGFFNTQLIDLQYLQNLFGPYVGLIEVKSESNDWFIVGIATGHYRKSCLVGTKKVFCGLLFLPEFRGYGFGELLALIGMTLLEINDKMDIVYEDATIRNEITAKLIKRVGFESYGLVSKQEYDITCRDCVGIYRTFRYSSKILQNQLLTEKDDRKKKILLQRIQLNESLKRTIKCLIRKNILNNIIY